VSAAPMDRLQLYELVRSLTPDERRILLSLRDRGPALPLEIAVRLLKMPNEIAEPLARLTERGLVQPNATNESAFGSNVLRLSDLGNQVVAILKDRSLLAEIDAAVAPPAAQAQEAALTYRSAPDPREREVEILLKRAEVARERGDFDAADHWLDEALAVQRAIAGR
jgi:DNA-binding MarR family transcriptional regulator